MPLAAQTASLRGQITDESGAVIPGAKVTLTSPSRPAKTTTAAIDGVYSFAGLAPGVYTIEATAPDLTMPQPVQVSIKTGVQTLNLQLKVALNSQQVTVQESAGPTVATDPSSNASAIILRGEDLQALGDDPEDLQADLQALAGPAAGPNGGSIYIDGFSGGQLPAKDSIREIRINSNPFAPEYDKLGFGRIEIFTKPGTDKFRGTASFNFGDAFWNSRDPFAQRKAPFRLIEFGGSLSGPIGKRASFFVDVQRHAIDNGDIVNGIILDPATLAIVNPYTNVFRTPQRRINVSPRVDYQINANNTLTARYAISQVDIRDTGIGSLNLIERGYHAQSTSHTAQISETAILGASVINETRFQFFRVDASNIANNAAPAIQVLGAFNGGGSPAGRSFDLQNSYELQNYTSITHGSHSWRFGVRLRGDTDRSTSPQNFAGTFTFAGGLAPQLDASNQPVLDAAGAPVLIAIQSIQRYQRTLFLEKLGLPPADIRRLGGGASQFTINTGVPLLSTDQVDLGAFVGDDWRVRANFTVSLGLRYETQTNIHDRSDFAPRAGFAWAPGARGGKAPPKLVVRGGFGVFYDRFALANTLAAMRYNGIVQQQYVISQPDFFPSVPSLASLANSQLKPSIQEKSATLRAPYVVQPALAIERQLPFHTTIALTYALSHGLHQLRSSDINAPLPGTFNTLVPGSGVFPFGNPGPILLMESSGLYNQNQLILNVNSKLNRNVSLFGYYVYNRAMSNTDGLGTFPANQYNYSGEYGPALTDVHHRVSIGGSIVTKWDVRLNPLFTASSGPPFDITTGSDQFGDTLFNARPGIATDPTRPGVIATQYGLLDPNPSPQEKILPRNFGRGPGSLMLNLRISKLFSFGPSRESGSAPGIVLPGAGDRRGTPGVFSAGGGQGASVSGHGRYALSFTLSIRNLLNHTNPGPIIGNVTSPLFGQANQTAGGSGQGGANFSESANNRRLEAQVRFSF